MATKEYTYKEKRYSATQLLDSIRALILKRRHNDEIEQDVSQMILALFGTAVHGVLEHAGTADDELAENKIEVELKNKYTLSAIFDLYSEGERRVTDYKSCSVWKCIYSDFEDWRKQLLIYAWGLRKIGFECNSGRIIAIMRDHQQSKAKFDPSYPQSPVKEIIFNFKEEDFNEIEKWIYSRFDEIIAAEKLPDNELPMCTEKERFNKGASYAVMKKGRKTAMRVLDNKDAAEAWMRDNGGEYIEERKGTDTKCVDGYCSVCQFCDYYNKNYGEIN